MLPGDVENLVNLQVLVLRDNDLLTVPRELGRLSKLKELHIQGNRLVSIPPEVGNLDLIGPKQVLRLEHNPWMPSIQVVQSSNRTPSGFRNSSKLMEPKELSDFYAVTATNSPTGGKKLLLARFRLRGTRTRRSRERVIRASVPRNSSVKMVHPVLFHLVAISPHMLRFLLSVCGLRDLLDADPPLSTAVILLVLSKRYILPNLIKQYSFYSPAFLSWS